MADVVLSAVHPLITEYLATLTGKAEATVDAYRQALRDLVTCIAARPRTAAVSPDHLTRTALDVYLAQLASAGTSISHRAPRQGRRKWLRAG
jgi:site-specific recombinase XerD